MLLLLLMLMWTMRQTLKSLKTVRFVGLANDWVTACLQLLVVVKAIFLATLGPIVPLAMNQA